MSITKKLKELIVAFGAAQNVSAVKGNRIDGLIGTLAAWIAEHGVGGGSSLPAVSGADNGKVLGVSSGEWAAVAAPTELPAVTGGDDGKVLGVSSGAWAPVSLDIPAVIRVPFTLTTDPGTGTMSGSTDAVYADVLAAINAGAIAVADCRLELSGAVTHLMGIMSGVTSGVSTAIAAQVMSKGTDYYVVEWDGEQVNPYGGKLEQAST